jgi:DNA-binding MarR family transcriptional regulator
MLGADKMKNTSNSQAIPLLIGLVRRIRDCCQRKEGEICQELTLTSSQFACLLAMPETGALNVNELGEAIELSPSRTSRVVDSLVRLGLLDRQTTDNDRRQQHLTLTSAGLAKWHKAHLLLGECEQRLLSHLSGQQARELEDALKMVIQALKVGAQEQQEAKDSAAVV